MKRINVIGEDDKFEGWFDYEKATVVASFHEGNPYVDGKELLATKQNKLVVNIWSNTGRDYYRFARDPREIAEILAKGNYEDTDEKLLDILKKYEL